GFGLLAVGVEDGSGSGSAGVTLRLTDPGTHRADGRITLGELFGGLSQLTTLLPGLFDPLPTWTDQGPGPMINAQLTVPPNNAAAGAVQSIATHPGLPTHLLVGTANGGVWRTTNADPANPAAVAWTPLTDNLGSLSIGTVAYDRSDLTGNTFYVGTGEFSNAFDGAGRAVGVYRTTDAGATWTLLGGAGPAHNPLRGYA